MQCYHSEKSYIITVESAKLTLQSRCNKIFLIILYKFIISFSIGLIIGHILKGVRLDDSSLPQHGDKVLSGVCAWHRASIQGVVKPALLLQLQVLVTHFTDVRVIKLTQVLPDILKMC